MIKQLPIIVSLMCIAVYASAEPKGASYFNGGISLGGVVLNTPEFDALIQDIPGYRVDLYSSGLARGEFGVSVHPFKYLHLNGGLAFSTFNQTYRYQTADGEIIDNTYEASHFGLHLFPSIDFTYFSVGYGVEALVGTYGKSGQTRYFFGLPSGFVDAKIQLPGLLGNRSVVHVGYRRQTHQIQTYAEPAQAEYLYIGLQWLTEPRGGSNNAYGDWGDFNYDDYPDYPY
ncbi:hypothetical protein [Salinibius halmophilus]|uniref:hypothetical protein n=1 Tax=Salinibius halmophilus TaxID=1853216 RepID=UPI000E66A819|nr:hypothetical protein [Salinibius halmophilus]